MTSLPGAASLAVRELLTGPRRTGRVVAAFPSGVYAEVDGRLVAVEAAGGLRLPCAVLLGEPMDRALFGGVTAGVPVEAGERTLRLGDLDVRIARWWAPAVPRAARGPRSTSPLAADGWAPLPPRAVGPDDGAEAEGTAWDDLAVRWLGRGPGLTPAGDDLLTGLLVGLAGRPDLRDPLAAAVARHAPSRTTWLSAELLRLAAEGLAPPAVVRVADALAGHGTTAELTQATAALLDVGHTSGAALAHGLLLAARTDLRHPHPHPAAA